MPQAEKQRKALFGTAILACFVLAGSHAAAAPLNLPKTNYAYTVIDQDLPAALNEFGSNLGLRVSVSQAVRGRIRGRLPDASPRDFLDRLVALYNLQWYFDGQVLYVSSAEEAQSRVLVLGQVPFDRLQRTLVAFSITDERYTVQRAPAADLALASGPPRFVALVEQTVTALAAEEQARLRPSPESPAPRPETLLQVFRGSQAQYIRNGRPDTQVITEPPIVDPPPPARPVDVQKPAISRPPPR
jgi:type III secretion protein C